MQADKTSRLELDLQQKHLSGGKGIPPEYAEMGNWKFSFVKYLGELKTAITLGRFLDIRFPDSKRYDKLYFESTSASLCYDP